MPEISHHAGVAACILLGAAAPLLSQSAARPVVVRAGSLPKIATISDRFQSYNVEMVEVTGGRFWKPYGATENATPTAKPTQPKSGDTNQLPGIGANLFMYRPPIDLTSPKLRKLASGLAPAYVRVSGSWQNTTYFHDSDTPAPAAPPAGFNGVLTRKLWKGVIDFSNAVNAPIITSVAVSGGTRNADGVWTGDQAQKFFTYTRSAGGHIAATEFMNEPTIPSVAGVPQGYDAAAFGRDIAVFTPLLRKTLPGTLYLGPGSTAEGVPIAPRMRLVPTDALMKATGPVFDAFSYHFYGGVSQRCSRGAVGIGITADQALTADWFHRTDMVYDFYAGMQKSYLPGKPIWVTETGEAACGGDPWASTFLDSFRYLYQLGTLAKDGVQVVAHNTLAASDYALLDPATLDPRPNYWAALLWRRMMGTTVLDAGSSPAPNVYLFAQCLRGSKGGVALLAINANTNASQSLTLPVQAKRLTLTADRLESRQVSLNDHPLALQADDTLPATEGVAVPAGTLTLAPASITFLAMNQAGNAACR